MDNHIKKASLNEKPFFNNDKETLEEEISKEDISKAMKVQTEILKVLADNKCTTNETYTILAAMLESIYAFSIMKSLGYEK